MEFHSSVPRRIKFTHIPSGLQVPILLLTLSHRTPNPQRRVRSSPPFFPQDRLLGMVPFGSGTALGPVGCSVRRVDPQACSPQALEDSLRRHGHAVFAGISDHTAKCRDICHSRMDLIP